MVLELPLPPKVQIFMLQFHKSHNNSMKNIDSGLKSHVPIMNKYGQNINRWWKNKNEKQDN